MDGVKIKLLFQLVKLNRSQSGWVYHKVVSRAASPHHVKVQRCDDVGCSMKAAAAADLMTTCIEISFFRTSENYLLVTKDARNS